MFTVFPEKCWLILFLREMLVNFLFEGKMLANFRVMLVNFLFERKIYLANFGVIFV